MIKIEINILKKSWYVVLKYYMSYPKGLVSE